MSQRGTDPSVEWHVDTMLVTCGTLSHGGVQRSLVNLLNLIQHNVRKGVVLLPADAGTLVTELPNNFEVRTLPPHWQRLNDVSLRRTSIKTLARHPMATIRAALAAVKGSRPQLTKRFREAFGDAALRNDGDPCPDHCFDLLVQYAGGHGVWDLLATRALRAKRKVVWVHGDLSVFGTGTLTQKKMLSSYDGAVAVSEHGAASLLGAVPALSGKVHVIENYVSADQLRAASLESVDDIRFDRFTFCSVARLTPGKAVEVGVKAAKLLFDEGHVFQWVVVGDGPERNRLQALIDELGIHDVVYLLGTRDNPHRYVARSDVFLHTSESEGKSMAIQEALMLQKPVVVTRYPSVADQVQDGQNGLVTALAPKPLAEAMERVLKDSLLRAELTNRAEPTTDDPTTFTDFGRLVRQLYQ